MNHYYAARKTDASPLEIRTEVGNAVDGQREKFLFYRGIGNFPLPLTATVSAEGQVVVSTSNGQPVGDVMLFEKTGGTTGYQALRSAKQTVSLERPAAPRVPTPSVHSALERMLVAQGLYQKEAAASRHLARLVVRRRPAALLHRAAVRGRRDSAARDQSGAGEHGSGVRRPNRAHHAVGCRRSERGGLAEGSRRAGEARALPAADYRARPGFEPGR